MPRFGLSRWLIVDLHFQAKVSQKIMLLPPFVWQHHLLAKDNEKRGWCHMNSAVHRGLGSEKGGEFVG